MLSATALVVLHVMVWDCNGGRLLAEFTREMPDYAAAIETCRKTGVETARRLTQEWKAKGLSLRLDQRRLSLGAWCAERASIDSV